MKDWVLVPDRIGRVDVKPSSSWVPPNFRQRPPARRHILPQCAGLIRRRPDPDVPVGPRAPLGDDRQDLDALVPEGEATQRLVASMPGEAVHGNRDDVGTDVAG